MKVFKEAFNFSFFSITGQGIDLDYCAIAWFASETNRDLDMGLAWTLKTPSVMALADGFFPTSATWGGRPTPSLRAPQPFEIAIVQRIFFEVICVCEETLVTHD